MTIEANKQGLVSDVYFKCLFGARGNEKITQNFIENILGRKINSISTNFKLELEKSSITEKQMIADLIAKDGNLQKYAIEMQRKSNKHLPSRFVGYLSKIYVADIKVSQNYDELKQTILIVIMEEDFPFERSIENYHTIWSFREDNNPELKLTSDVQIHIIELNKYKEYVNNNHKTEPWLEFIINPYGEEVEVMARSYAELREAVEKLRLLESDEEVRQLADAEDFARLDRNTEILEARRDGEKSEKLKLAKKLIKSKMSMKEIIYLTELKKEEIEQIKKEQKLS